MNNTNPTQNKDLKVIYSQPSEFLIINKNDLVDNYHKYFGQALDGIGDLRFDIEEIQELFHKKTTFWAIKISAKGEPGWSYQEKCLIINNHGDILFEKDFRQIEPELKIPECGIPNYYFDTLDIIEIGNEKFLKTVIAEFFEPCGGQPKLATTNMILYSLEDFSIIDSVEIYYLHSETSFKTKLRYADMVLKTDTLVFNYSESIDDMRRKLWTTKYILRENSLHEVD